MSEARNGLVRVENCGIGGKRFSASHQGILTTSCGLPIPRWGCRVTAKLWVSLILCLFSCQLVLVSCGPSGPGGEGGPPRAPESLSFKVVAKGLKVAWNSVPGATHYTVFWGTQSTDYRKLANAPTNSLLISGLAPGKLYTFAVSSWNERGESDLSKEQLFVYDSEPGRAYDHLATGNSLIRKGAFTIALAYVSAAIRLDPESAEAYRIRALVNEKMRRSELARKDYAMAEKLYNKKPISSRPFLP